MSVSPSPLHPELLVPRADEMVCFLHVPKTAGTSFNLCLERQLCARPGAIARIPDTRFDAQLRATSAEALRPVRYLRTHWDHTVAGLLSKRVLFVTMLRDPVARLISLYEFFRALPPEVPSSQAALIRERGWGFARFALDDELWEDCDNRMARQIAGYVQGAHYSRVPNPGDRVRWMHPTRPAPQGEALLAQAKRHLDRFAFVGLTERFAESLELLEATFNWPQLHDVLTQNTASEHGGPRLGAIDPGLRRAILEKNWVDASLHHYAGELMDARLRQLRQERASGGASPPARPFSLGLLARPVSVPPEAPQGAVLVAG